MKSLKKAVLMILAIGLGIGSGLAVSLLFGDRLNNMIPNYWILQLVNELITTVIGIVLICIYRKTRVLRFSAENMKEGLICGAAWIIIPVLAVLNLLIDLRDIPDAQLIKWWEITALVLQCILIGFFEEGVFRGIATELSFELFGDDNKKNTRLSIAFASFLFGAVHLINALHPEISIKAAAMQAVSAFAIGLTFGAIYYRSGRTIWPCVIFHAIQDLSAFVIKGSLFGVTQEDAIGDTGIGQVIYSVLFVVWFLYLTREQESEHAEIHEVVPRSSI